MTSYTENHPSLSWAKFFPSFHDFPLLSTSLSFTLLHVPRGLPLFLVPWGFHSSALLVITVLSFLSVCPIRRYLLCPISFPCNFYSLYKRAIHFEEWLILFLDSESASTHARNQYIILFSESASTHARNQYIILLSESAFTHARNQYIILFSESASTHARNQYIILLSESASTHARN